MAAKKQSPLELTPGQVRLVRKRVKTGAYKSEKAVVDRALSLLEDHEADLRRLRRKIAVGLDQIERGEVIDGEEAFAKLLSRGSRKRKRSA